jgi:actin-related protein
MKRIVVIDNNTDISIIGFAGEPAPRFTFPTIYGEIKRVFPPIHFDKDYFNPDDVLEHPQDCVKRHVIESGLIEDWVGMNIIWEYCFKKLEIDPNQHGVLLIEADNNSVKRREKMADIMFLTHNVGALCIKGRTFLSSVALKEAPSDERLQAWLGGSIYCSQKEIQSEFVRIEEYDLEGPITLKRFL